MNIKATGSDLSSLESNISNTAKAPIWQINDMSPTLGPRDLYEKSLAESLRNNGYTTASESNAYDTYRKQLETLRMQQAKVEEFRGSYIKVRTDNIMLDHHSAIELTKMIFSEADTLTYEDTL